MEEGKDTQSIRAYIEAEYSQFGPPTDTDPIQDASQNSCSAATPETCGDDATLSSAPNPTNLPQMAVPQPPGGKSGSKEAQP